MSFLISVIGNTGVGKSSLANILAAETGWELIPEQHQERPFQKQASEGNKSSIFPNQIDYLLYRAEQESRLRSLKGIFIQDGGLDLDFHLFTKLFYYRGLLENNQFQVCRRLYQFFRGVLPGPDMIVNLTAPIEVIKQRKAGRGRQLDVSTVEDIEVAQEILDAWLVDLQDERMITLDVSEAAIDYHKQTSEVKNIAISRIVNE